MALSQAWASSTGFSDTIIYPAGVLAPGVNQHIAPQNFLAERKVSACAPLAQSQRSLPRQLLGGMYSS